MTAPQAPDWSAYSHRQIWDMVAQGKYEGAGQSALDYWTNARVTIMVIEKDLQQGLREIGSGWEGQAADAAAAGIGPLGQWALDAVERGRATTDALHNQSDYAYHTLRNMPPPDDADTPAARPAESGVFAGEAWEQANRRRIEDEARARDLMAAYQVNSESNTPALVGWTPPPQVVFGGGDGSGTGVGSAGAGGAGGAPPPGSIAAALDGPTGGAAAGSGAAGPGAGPGGGVVGPGSAGSAGVGGTGAGGSGGFGAGPGGIGPGGSGAGSAGAGGPIGGGIGTGGSGTGGAGVGGGPVGSGPVGAGPVGVGGVGAGRSGAGGGGGIGSGRTGSGGPGGVGGGNGAGGATGSGRPGSAAPGLGGPTTGRPGPGPGYGSTSTGAPSSNARLFAPPAPGGSTGSPAPTTWRDVVRANGGFAGGSPENGGGRPPTVEQAPRGSATPTPTGTGAAPARAGQPVAGHPGMMPMTGAGAAGSGETRRRAPYLLDDQGIFDVEHLLHFNPPIILPPDHPDHT